MTSTITPTEEFLLSNWEEVIKVNEGAASIQKKVDRLFEIVKTGLQNSEWWTKDFVKPVYRKHALFFWKKSWYFGNAQRDNVQIGMENLSLDNLLTNTVERPVAYVWTQRFGKNVQDKMEFQKLFNAYAKEIRSSLEFKTLSEPEYALYYELPYTSVEWTSILLKGIFVETILEQCNILARFIEPLDQAIARISTKNKETVFRPLTVK